MQAEPSLVESAVKSAATGNPMVLCTAVYTHQAHTNLHRHLKLVCLVSVHCCTEHHRVASCCALHSWLTASTSVREVSDPIWQDASLLVVEIGWQDCVGGWWNRSLISSTGPLSSPSPVIPETGAVVLSFAAVPP